MLLIQLSIAFVLFSELSTVFTVCTSRITHNRLSNVSTDQYHYDNKTQNDANGDVGHEAACRLCYC